MASQPRLFGPIWAYFDLSRAYSRRLGPGPGAMVAAQAVVFFAFMLISMKYGAGKFFAIAPDAEQSGLFRPIHDSDRLRPNCA